MALLRAQDSSSQVYLPARCLIGRSRACDVVIDQKHISSQHAALEWMGSDWEACDLGSRNGTYVNGHRLAAGERGVLRQGMELRFGRESSTWVLVESTPPQLMALELATGTFHLAEGGYLVLPRTEAPECGFYQDTQGRWHAETNGEPRPIEDRAVIATADGALWRIYLPNAMAGTISDGSAPLLLGQFRLRFAFTRDEEHIELAAVSGTRFIDLHARSYHYPLLLLARQRLADIQANLPEPGQGWIQQDQLLKMMRMTENLLNLSIHRARTQLGKLGFVDAADLIQRRHTRQLRIGCSQLDLAPLDAVPPPR